MKKEGRKGEEGRKNKGGREEGKRMKKRKRSLWANKDPTNVPLVFPIYEGPAYPSPPTKIRNKCRNKAVTNAESST
jgi:hypothetical protein